MARTGRNEDGTAVVCHVFNILDVCIYIRVAAFHQKATWIKSRRCPTGCFRPLESFQQWGSYYATFNVLNNIAGDIREVCLHVQDRTSERAVNTLDKKSLWHRKHITSRKRSSMNEEREIERENWQSARCGAIYISITKLAFAWTQLYL